MLSFSSKQILVLVLVAFSLNEASANSCEAQEEKPEESVSFAATEDDTAGAKISGYVEIKDGDKYSYVPLKLQKVEQIGHLEDHKSSKVKLILDCATVEMELHISTQGRNYDGKVRKMRVTFGDKVRGVSKPALNFSRSVQGGNPDYNLSWNPFVFEQSGWFHKKSKTVVFNKIGFILESKNVAYKYQNQIKNDIGFQAGWH